MVTVLVGPEKEKFIVHQEFLTYHPPYFAAALEGNFDKASTKIVELYHTTAGAFGLFVRWIYTKDISHETDSLTLDKTDSGVRLKVAENIHSRKRDLVDLWILADYL